MARVVVIGGGVGGLGAALALAQSGHAVTVLERDAMPLPATPVEAFARWERRGAPQVRHSHAFLARLRNLLLARAPELHAALLEAGASELRFADAVPATISDWRPEPGDDEIVLLACRRITFEWALRRLMNRHRLVSIRGGVEVSGLEGERDRSLGVPRVRGVRLRGPGGARERLAADVVVDASGRRSRLPAWLAGLGAPAIAEESETCGIFYCSRFYRLRAGRDELRHEGPIGADLGYMKVGVFPGDADILSITLAASPDDAPLRALLRPGPFDAAARSLPSTRDWIDPARAEPITGVHAMAKLQNRRRRFVRDGRPVALGIHAIGDASVCTNPLYGRGCALAFVHAYLLADALAAHPDEEAAAALALDAATRREIVPWYHAARAADRDARERAEAERLGATQDAPSSTPGGVVDPKAFMRSVMRDGLLPALRSDAVVLRRFVRSFHLLDAPDAFTSDADVMRRILDAWRERDRRPPPEPQGPPRDEMLRVLARAAA